MVPTNLWDLFMHLHPKNSSFLFKVLSLSRSYSLQTISPSHVGYVTASFHWFTHTPNSITECFIEINPNSTFWWLTFFLLVSEIPWNRDKSCCLNPLCEVDDSHIPLSTSHAKPQDADQISIPWARETTNPSRPVGRWYPWTATWNPLKQKLPWKPVEKKGWERAFNVLLQKNERLQPIKDHVFIKAMVFPTTRQYPTSKVAKKKD